MYSLAAVGTPAHFELFEKEPADVVADFKKRGLIREPGFPRDLDHWIDGFKEIEPRRWIAHLRAKHILIVHGDADELIPVEHSRDIFKHAAAGVAELHVIPGGVHRLRLDPRCIGMLNEWFFKDPRMESVTWAVFPILRRKAIKTVPQTITPDRTSYAATPTAVSLFP